MAKIKIFIFFAFALLILGCVNSGNSKIKDNTQIANPASVYCKEQGNNLEIRSDEQGNQYGICIFPDGHECEEWQYFRGECR